MTLEQIETFLTVIEAGSLRGASQRLYKSQPTLTNAIKNLESSLGVKLFSRDGYRLKTTEHGEALAIKAQEIRESTKNFERFAQEISQGQEAIIKASIDSLFTNEDYFQFIKYFHSICGQTSIEMDFDVLGGVEEKVLNKQVDFGITPFINKLSKIDYHLMGNIEMIPVVRQGVFTCSSPPISELNFLPQILVKDSAINKGDRDFGLLDRNLKWKVSHYHVKKDLILQGLGWGNLELRSIREHLNKGALIELEIEALKSQKIPLYFISHKEKPLGPISKKLKFHLLNS